MIFWLGGTHIMIGYLFQVVVARQNIIGHPCYNCSVRTSFLHSGIDGECEAKFTRTVNC